MKYGYLICLVVISLCVGTFKAVKAVKNREMEAEPLDKSFAVYFIAGIPMLIASVYCTLNESGLDLWLLLGTIILSGIVALFYGISCDRRRKRKS